MAFTLVEHAAIGKAVEAVEIRKRDLTKVRNARGLVLEVGTPADVERVVNFPPGVGLNDEPCVEGSFTSMRINGRRLYVPTNSDRHRINEAALPTRAKLELALGDAMVELNVLAGDVTPLEQQIANLISKWQL